MRLPLQCGAVPVHLHCFGTLRLSVDGDERPLPATALASALMALALLVGILLGMQITAGAPL